MKFKKKPVIINAEQFDGSAKSFEKICAFTDYQVIEDDGQLYIKTLEGNMKISKNDWVIRGVNGEFYPCKPEIFKKTYEKVTE